MNNLCDLLPANVHDKPIYITLTLTTSSANIDDDEGKKEYERLLSDFTTVFSTQIQLNPYRKWTMALADAFIPVDTRLNTTGNSTRDNWFKYGYGLGSNNIFPTKNFFYPSTPTESFNEFAKTLSNLKLQDNLSMIGLDSIVEVGITTQKIANDSERHGCMYIKLKQNLKGGCGINILLPKPTYKSFVGTANTGLFFTYVDGAAIYGVYCVWREEREDMKCTIRSREDLRKGVCFISPFKIGRQQRNNTDRLIDIECSVLESTHISGVPGRILRTILDRHDDFGSLVNEAKRLLYVPVELHEFQTIRVRILDHKTKLPIKYDYDTVIGKPFITVRLEPRYG